MSQKHTGKCDVKHNEPIGNCPECGCPVYLGSHSFYCHRYQERACGFRIEKSSFPAFLGREVFSVQVITELLSGKTVLLHKKSVDFPISYWGKIQVLRNKGWGIELFAYNPDSKKITSPVRRVRRTV